MNRREFATRAASVAGAALLAGCSLGGDVILRKQDIGPTAATTEWERDLEEGQQLELRVEAEGGTNVGGYVQRASGGEAVAEVTSGTATDRQEFEVPSTDTYVVGIEVNSSGSGTIVLQEA